MRRSDVRSAWSGIRPLAIDPSAKDTASALRDHIVHVADDGLVTITGWRLVPSIESLPLGAGPGNQDVGDFRAMIRVDSFAALVVDLPCDSHAFYSQ